MTTNTETYDYIIVGAGSAGCVVARRLSDQPDCRVLLLEAGPPADDFWVRTPAGMAKLFKSERYNWRYYTEPVPTLRNRKLYWPRGKALGGSSAINGMVYVRGDRKDFDQWAEMGNPGWSWKEVLPYFKLSENNVKGDGPFHSTKGPLYVSDPAVKHPSLGDFIQAARNAGLKQIDDFNTGEQEGVGYLQANIRKGIRQSAYDAFLAPVKDRSNLTIKTGVHVRRVLFDGKDATGVEVMHEGQVRQFPAAREVILCAGALISPHLLMLSGIGDSTVLQGVGIQPLVHSPGVGKNLQDHFSVRVQFETTRDSSYNYDLTGWRKYWQGARYVFTKGGYLAMASSSAAAFVRSGPEIDFPDLEISFRPMTFTYQDSGRVDVDGYHAVSASVYRVRPASRGSVDLRSADPMEPPAFNPNYLGDPEDIKATLVGLRRLRQILATEPFKSRVVKEMVPGVGVQTDEQWVDFMEQSGHCAFHPAGTCKMGKDPMAVVDERLRVHGVGRLRVVDASIMPVVTSGNTNAPTVMIGEKGADMIRADAVARRA